MEKRAWLRVKQQLAEGRRRKTHIATASGRKALKLAREQVRQLYEEMFEEHS